MDYQLIIIKLGDGYMGSHYASLSTVVYNIIFSKIKKKKWIDHSLSWKDLPCPFLKVAKEVTHWSHSCGRSYA